MPALRKYDDETGERAVRMYQDRRRDFPQEAALQARRRVGELLDVKPETLRGWIERVEIDAGQRPGVPSAVEARVKELERDNAELRRANEILKTASAFFAAADLPSAQRARRGDRPEHLLRPSCSACLRRRVGRRAHGQRRAGAVAGQPQPLRG